MRARLVCPGPPGPGRDLKVVFKVANEERGGYADVSSFATVDKGRSPEAGSRIAGGDRQRRRERSEHP